MLDKKLEIENNKYNDIKAPDNMEEKLKDALNRVDDKKKRLFPKVASFIIIAGLLIGMNSNSIAGYIRDRSIDERLVGQYSEIMPEKLKELEAEGIVQDVSKKIILDGREIFIDGIIVDSLGVNVFVEGDSGAFSTIKLTDGEKTGEYKELLSSGQGIVSHDKTRERWNYYFKGELENDSIVLEFTNNDSISKTIPVDIDENTRLKTLDKLKINQNIKIGKNNYYIKNIYISPLTILLEGYNENIIELGFRSIFNIRKDYGNVDIDLIINGERVEQSEAGRSTDMGGMTFEHRYNEFPSNIDSLEIEVVEREDGHIVRVFDSIRVK